MADRYNAWEGKLVRLRAPSPDDPTFDEDSELQRNGWMIHLPVGPGYIKARAEEASQRAPIGRADDNWSWTMEALDTGQAVGTLNAHGCDRRNRTFEYGISVAAEHQGKGYGSDALKLVCRHYFDELGYHKLGAIVYAFNAPSIRFHERFGFTLEGRIREQHFTAGAHHDALWYGLLAREFWAKYPDLRTGPGWTP